MQIPEWLHHVTFLSSLAAVTSSLLSLVAKLWSSSDALSKKRNITIQLDGGKTVSLIGTEKEKIFRLLAELSAETKEIEK